MQRLLPPALVLFLTAAASMASAGPIQPEWWMDRGQLYIGGTLENIGSSVDTFISRDTSPSDNDTYLRVRLARVFYEGESVPKHDFNLRSDLPKTRGHLQLIIESEQDDFEPLLEQDQNESSGQSSLNNNQNNGIETALRYIRPGVSKWNPNLDVGIRSKLPLDPFVKLRVKRDFHLANQWRFRNHHELYYYHQNGWGEKSTFQFAKPLGEDWSFSDATDIQWSKDEGRVEYDNIVTFVNYFSENKRYTYRFGFFSQEQPRSLLMGYFVEAGYRRRLYQDLLYAEMTPAVRWVRANDFNDEPSLTFRLLMYFKN